MHAGLEAAVTPNYERAAMPEQNTDPCAPAQPMDAERLSDLRHYVATSTTPAGSWIPDADGRDTLSELLADRDRLAAEVARLAGERPGPEGPKVTVSRSCFDCRHCESRPYKCQSDSGHYVRCLLAARDIGDTTWSTPAWCPVAPAPEHGAGS